MNRQLVIETQISVLYLHCASPNDTTVFLAHWISISELFYDVRYSVLNLVILMPERYVFPVHLLDRSHGHGRHV